MNFERWVDPRVALVRVAQLRAYLEDHGWRSTPFPRPQVIRYEGPPADDGEPLVAFAPATEALRDYRRGVVDLITRLSDLEDRHPVDVLNEMLQYSASDQTPQVADHNGANAPAATAGKAQPQ